MEACALHGVHDASRMTARADMHSQNWAADQHQTSRPRSPGPAVTLESKQTVAFAYLLQVVHDTCHRLPQLCSSRARAQLRLQAKRAAAGLQKEHSCQQGQVRSAQQADARVDQQHRIRLGSRQARRFGRVVGGWQHNRRALRHEAAPGAHRRCRWLPGALPSSTARRLKDMP